MGFIRTCYNVLPLLLNIVAFTFSILVLLGGTSSTPNSFINSVYFIKINTTEIVSSSIPASGIINSVAQKIGIQNFYTASLWSYCEGNIDGVRTFCSPPTTLYQFDPIKIISQQLFSGVVIDVPQSLQNDLNNVHTAQRWSFALYMTGTIILGLCLFVGFAALFSWCGSVFATIMAFFGGACILAASIIATVLWTIVVNSVKDVPQLGVTASLGGNAIAFTWIAAGTGVFAFIFYMFGICCCGGRERRQERPYWSRREDGPYYNPKY